MKLFAVYDTKASFYLQPFPETSTVSALRGFDQAVNADKGSTFSRFPDDFALHELATFDQQTGEILVHDKPQNLGTARTVLKTTHHNTLPFNGAVAEQ